MDPIAAGIAGSGRGAFGRSLGPVVVSAALLGAAAAAVGMFVSFHVEIASGPAIVLASSGGFAIALVASTVSGAVLVRRARASHSVMS